MRVCYNAVFLAVFPSSFFTMIFLWDGVCHVDALEIAEF